MALSTRRSRRPSIDIWPGFVDALAQLLMVIIFVLLVFTAGQFLLSDALSGRDRALQQLQLQLNELSNQVEQNKSAIMELMRRLASTNSRLGAIEIGLAAVIAWPLLRGGRAGSEASPARAEAEARALRHRVALEALLDVEADRRAGSLDEASYERERAEAEARAAETLEQGKPADAPPVVVTGGRRGRQLVVGRAWP